MGSSAPVRFISSPVIKHGLEGDVAIGRRHCLAEAEGSPPVLPIGHQVEPQHFTNAANANA